MINLIENNKAKIPNYLRSNSEFLNDYVCTISPTFVPSLVRVIFKKWLGYRIAVIPDGIFEFSNVFYNPLSYIFFRNIFFLDFYDLILIYGDDEFEFIKICGVAPSKVMKIPYLTKNSLKSSGAKLLITTANSPYFNEEELILLIEIYRAIIKACDDLGVNVIYRFYDENFKKIIPPGGYNDIQSDFGSLISDVGFIITTPSTIVLDALAFDIPVGQVHIRTSPIFLQSGWNIFSSTNMLDLLRSMLRRESERMAFQQFTLQKYQLKSQSVVGGDVGRGFRFSPKNFGLSKFIYIFKKLFF